MSNRIPAPTLTAYQSTLDELSRDAGFCAQIAEVVSALGLERAPLPRGMLYTCDALRNAVALSLTTLRLCARRSTRGKSDYYWKHQAERLSRLAGQSEYVPRAAMLIAAKIEGVPIRNFAIVPQDEDDSSAIPSGMLGADPTAAWRKLDSLRR